VQSPLRARCHLAHPSRVQIQRRRHGRPRKV
jgi:hypothetical protein